jgi:outer membrane assembly lipoprotein YfiO
LFWTFALVGMVLSAPAWGQSKEYRLDPAGGWEPSRIPTPGTDEAVIADARQMLAQRRYGAAETLLDAWIEANENSKSPWLAEAYLLRGDARLGNDDEEDALRDYEEVVQGYTGSDMFPLALEREMDVALLYLNGLRRRVLGFRIDSGVSLAEEILLRINERLPGSRLAERALLELADYYYRSRDLRMASESYDVFLRLYPQSEYRQKAMQRRVYANIARFKGPKYDATGLTDAKLQVEQFAREYPVEAEAAGMSDALVARLDESAAAQMLDTGSWYMKQSDPVSARLTFRRLIRKYPTTAAAARALDIIDREGWGIRAPSSRAGASRIPVDGEPEAAKQGETREDQK